MAKLQGTKNSQLGTEKDPSDPKYALCSKVIGHIAHNSMISLHGL
jgi:hypothetical protein